MRLARLLALPAILGALVLTQAAGISPASAAVSDPSCNYVIGHYNACLRFLTPEIDDSSTAHVGLDLYTQFGSQYGAFQAALYAEQDGPDLFIGYLNLLPGWPSATSQSVGVELSRTFALYQLDVNNGFNESFYAEIFYDDPFGNRLSKRTGTVRGEFASDTGGGGGGGGGCFEQCQ
jgi:hypothetical protein